MRAELATLVIICELRSRGCRVVHLGDAVPVEGMLAALDSVGRAWRLSVAP